MNQDFLMQGGPGVARQLVKLSGFCKINLDPAIIDLASTGYVDLEDCSFSETDKNVIQTIIDYDLRCILPTQSTVAPGLIAKAAKLQNVSPIFVLTRSGRQWTTAFAKEGYKFEEDVFILQPEKIRKTGLENDFIRNRRQGLLIVDNLSASDMSYFAQDFPKTIIVTHRRLVVDMGEFINVLFGGATGDIMTRNALTKRRMETMGFDSQTPPMNFAFMFKIITDHLAEAEQAATAGTGFSASFDEVQTAHPEIDDDLCF